MEKNFCGGCDLYEPMLRENDLHDQLRRFPKSDSCFRLIQFIFLFVFFSQRPEFCECSSPAGKHVDDVM